jgi:hypothetical protein
LLPRSGESGADSFEAKAEFAALSALAAAPRMAFENRKDMLFFSLASCCWLIFGVPSTRQTLISALPSFL